jgi:hypothetical protein
MGLDAQSTIVCAARPMGAATELPGRKKTTKREETIARRPRSPHYGPMLQLTHL